MKRSVPTLNRHRFARLIRWALTLLAWLALVLFSETARVNRRRIRRRYGFVSLVWIERLVRALAIIRAVEIAGISERRRPPARNAAPAGFRRRIERRNASLRTMVGARFSSALKHRDPAERIRRLMAALADIDAFVRRYLVKRLLRRLTKLCAIVMFAPPAAAVTFLAAPPAEFADTS
jgi:hypothetical protein